MIDSEVAEDDVCARAKPALTATAQKTTPEQITRKEFRKQPSREI
jgi:hypothetical protein